MNIVEKELKNLYDHINHLGDVVEEEYGWRLGPFDELWTVCEKLKSEILFLLESGQA
jgi:hypothetical protein